MKTGLDPIVGIRPSLEYECPLPNHFPLLVIFKAQFGNDVKVDHQFTTPQRKLRSCMERRILGPETQDQATGYHASAASSYSCGPTTDMHECRTDMRLEL